MIRLITCHINHEANTTIMSTKNSSKQTSGINWPKTPQRQIAEEIVAEQELQQKQEKIAAVAKVGQIMTAASAIPNAHAKRLLGEAMQEATKPTHQRMGKKKGKNRDKRTHEHHSDKYFEDNRAWDEVEGIRLMCLDVLRTAGSFAPLLRNVDLLTHVASKRLLSRNIAAIGRDTQVLAEVVSKVHKLHMNKKGGTKTQEEMFQSYEVYSQYVDFMERYDAALMPIIVHASEQLQEALLALNKVNPELANQLNMMQQLMLNKVQSIIHETTGADDVVSPGAVPELQETVTAESAVA